MVRVDSRNNIFVVIRQGSCSGADDEKPANWRLLVKLFIAYIVGNIRK